MENPWFSCGQMIDKFKSLFFVYKSWLFNAFHHISVLLLQPLAVLVPKACPHCSQAAVGHSRSFPEMSLGLSGFRTPEQHGALAGTRQKVRIVIVHVICCKAIISIMVCCTVYLYYAIIH